MQGQFGRRLAPVFVAGASTIMAVSALVLGLASVGWATSLASYSVSAAGIGLSIALIGALVLREVPSNSLGVLMSASGLWATLGALCAALVTVVPSGSALQLAMVLVQGTWPPAVFMFLLVPQLYPHGTVMSPRWRIPLVVTITAATTSTLALMTSQYVLDGHPDLAHPFPLPIPGAVVDATILGGALVVVGMAVAALVGQALRMRRAPSDERARISWLMTAVLLMIIAFVGPSQGIALLIEVAAIICLGVGIARHQLFDIETVLSRALVYVIVIGVSLAAALAAAAMLGTLSGVGVLPALAAAVTALALAASFGRLKRRVDWILYGRRSDPGKAIAFLGERLASAPASDDVLPIVVSTLRESLRLPYAAVTLVDEDGPAATSGERPDRTVTFPLRYGGLPVGTLEVGLRRGDRELAAADHRLIATFVAQAGASAHGAQVTRDLRRSRERLVRAREEERRIMRRELHDGLGPALAGMSLGLESLHRGAATEGQARLAWDLMEQAQQSLSEVRSLARDLRPAALDELGLAAAVRQQAQVTSRLTGGHPQVAVHVVTHLPDLPAAVEVAAYRIIQEGLMNAVRHANAANCVVEISSNGSLLVRVDDDGDGLTPSQSGAGLRSMRERAEELGGLCTVTFAAGTGTSVCAQLPLPRTSGDADRAPLGDAS